MKTNCSSKNLGRRGEILAALYLKRAGYLILEKNYHLGRNEIDIIAKKDNIIVAAEVKTRTISSVTNNHVPLSSKQAKRLKTTLLNYCHTQLPPYHPIRLDVLLITYNKKTGLANLCHYLNV